MGIKWLLAILILIVFISGCLELDGDEIKPTYSDNALKMETSIKEKEEGRRILPDQTIRMVVTLTNQVEDATDNVELKITDPHGILISKVDCGSNCTCELNAPPSDGCDSLVNCSYNGCYYKSIQSLDEEEITFGLKIPGEEQISAAGRDLKPEIMLEYDYSGTSALYIPIYKYGEKPAEPKKESTQTTGPIHVDIDSDDWVRAGDLFPIYVDVEDVAHSTEDLMIPNDTFKMSIGHADVKDETGEKIGRCDFEGPTDDFYFPEENITLPLKNPLVCTLRAHESDLLTAPMVKASIIIDYSYTYKVEKTEKISVEKAILGIF